MSTNESSGLSPEINPSQSNLVPTSPLSNPAIISPSPPTPLRVTPQGRYNHDVTFTLSGLLSDEVGLSHGDKLILVVDPASPWCVGLSGNPNLTSNRQTPRYRRRTSRTKGYWKATLYPDQVQAFFSEDLENKDAEHYSWPFYDPEITLDAGGKTIWFPLPYGRSIHHLRRYFGSFEVLDNFILNWFDSTYPSQFIMYENKNGYYRFNAGDPSRIDHDVHVGILEELLQDPIRNGSSDKAHGFNPWNLVQHQQILDFLETEIRAQIEGV